MNEEEKYMSALYPNTKPHQRKKLLAEIYHLIHTTTKTVIKWDIPMWLPKWDIENLIGILRDRKFVVRKSHIVNSLFIGW